MGQATGGSGKKLLRPKFTDGHSTPDTDFSGGDWLVLGIVEKIQKFIQFIKA